VQRLTPPRLSRTSPGASARRAAWAAALACATWCLAPQSARAADAAERLQVADPYLELRTGPGRGYPVFFVVERDQWVELELRSTDWYLVRTEKGKEGWVHRDQLAHTLTMTGAPQSFRDVLYEDYLRRRAEFGAAWGFVRSDPFVKVWTDYRVSKNFTLEATGGQVQGRYSSSNVWSLNLLAEPWSQSRVAPYAGIGVGKFIIVPHASLVGAITSNSRMTDATAGVRWHVSQRLVARLDYTAYFAATSDQRLDEYRAWTAGLSFFF